MSQAVHITGHTNGRQPPQYFEQVRSRSQARWNQLEADPELAGPWRQLFSQVQSPRHVVSELLQNADDAGAQKVSARIEDGFFIFEHDGGDFTEEQFASLCRFGFSNKRNLHTIGFRGIGFKSTFSIGDAVEVWSPSLAIRFNKRRFTEPYWAVDAPPSELTVVRVAIRDANAERELRRNLEEWANSPTSLLFFNSITELSLADKLVRKEILGPGPVSDSERIALTGCGDMPLILFRSPEVPFPEESIDEIRQERNTDDLNLPPCRVEIVLGLPGKQRLYVVLPTGVEVNLPFSCNAPFLQDPARTAIKDTSLSATNRWLLDRAGKLAAAALQDWLGDTTTSLADRANAYNLLPPNVNEADSIAADTANRVRSSCANELDGKPILLAYDGVVSPAMTCLTPPVELYDVWSNEQLTSIFKSESSRKVLAREVRPASRQVLESWEWLRRIAKDRVIELLSCRKSPPKPSCWEALFNLWVFVASAVQSDYTGERRRRVNMFPVEGDSCLFPADDVVRLAAKMDANDGGGPFLTDRVRILDREWLAWGGAIKDKRSQGLFNEMLRVAGLSTASSSAKLFSQACADLFDGESISIADCIRMAQLIACQNIPIPEEFRYITRNKRLRSAKEGIVLDAEGELDRYLPSNWADAHMLHPGYYSETLACSPEEWLVWAKTSKSGLSSIPDMRPKRQSLGGLHDIKQLAKERAFSPPASYQYPYATYYFELHDYGYEDALLEHWNELSKADPAIWSFLLCRILNGSDTYWKLRLCARLHQISRQGNPANIDLYSSPIPCEWVVHFRGVACLPDTHGQLRVPGELLLRTPDTEPLMGVEPFIQAELDNPTTRPLLKLLGVRDTPTSMDNLLGRIRALATLEEPLSHVHEIAKWYDALDRAMARCRPDALQEVRDIFSSESLILTEAGEWLSTDSVYQNASEDDVPGVSIVHSSIHDLSLWTRLGVAERPTVELVMKWLKCIPASKELDTKDIKRIKLFLSRYPDRIWSECRHWLALDGCWISVSQIEYGATLGSADRLVDLFPAIKRRTADLRMLKPEVREQAPFVAIRSIGSAIEYRLTEKDGDPPPPRNVVWLVALGRGLKWVQLDDAENTERVREVADRLSRTIWQPVRHLRIEPYIAGTPAGQPHAPDVLWDDNTLYVQERSITKLVEPVVAELSRPFGLHRIVNAIRICYERDGQFIAEYLKDNFEFDPPMDEIDEQPPEGDEEGQTSSEGQGSGGDANVDLPTTPQNGEEMDHDTEEPDDIDSTPPSKNEPQRQTRERKDEPKEPTLISKYAKAKGYHWDDNRKMYVHTDGTTIRKVEGQGVFNWELYSSNGEIVRRYWVSEHCLEGPGGAELRSELWELIKKNPGISGLILQNKENKPHEWQGDLLVRMAEGGAMKLYPAKYRLRLKGEGE